MEERKRLEIVVGTFVVAGTLIFSFFIFFVGGIYFFKPGYHIDVKFNTVAGIAKGASVRFAGVPVGEVVSIKTVYDAEDRIPQVVVRLWIKEGTEVRENSRIDILGAFALSEAHIAIASQGLQDGPLVKEGQFMEGNDPVPLDDLISEGEQITRKLREILDGVTEFVTDDEIREGIRGIIVNMSTLTERMNKIISGSEDDIKGIIDNTDISLQEFAITSQKLRAIFDRIEERQGTVGKLVNDEELYNELLAFVRDLKAHPWKLLKKGKEPSSDDKKDKKFLGIF